MAFDERSTHLQLAIEIIADKWRIALLHLLSGDALRTSQLQRRLEDVSPKMLTQTLRGLERDGLVERVAYPEVPPRVEYRLTARARHLLDALDDLCRWSETYGSETRLARCSYDLQIERISDLPSSSRAPSSK